jgi:hypothetical protein
VTRVTGRIALWGTLGAPAELTEYPGLAKTAFADADRLFRALERRIPKSRTAPSDEPAPA